MSKIVLDELENALKSLEESLLISNPTTLERDGIIKRFEYTFELSWKIGKKFLEEQGIQNLTSPKNVIREMAINKLIDNPDFWFIHLDNRNLTSHTYKEVNAKKVFDGIPTFSKDCRNFFELLKNKNG